MTNREDKTYEPPQQEEEKKTGPARGRKPARARKKQEEEVKTKEVKDYDVEIEYLKGVDGKLKPVRVSFYLTSFKWLQEAMEIMEEYDFTL